MRSGSGSSRLAFAPGANNIICDPANSSQHQSAAAKEHRVEAPLHQLSQFLIRRDQTLNKSAILCIHRCIGCSVLVGNVVLDTQACIYKLVDAPGDQYNANYQKRQQKRVHPILVDRF